MRFILKKLILVVFLSFNLINYANALGNDSTYHTMHPLKPGLTLSGGGAKGLAHIGVLHILDSLGIEVRVITGTSMGSIIGGMYAAGYSANEIEKFATNIDWESLFSPRPSLLYIPPQNRNNSGNNIIELSVESGKIKLPTGAIEGQQLWNTLNEIFLPVYKTRNFEQLPVPFACVATDVATGTPVVMKNGNLTSAIRASMAIPSVFTTVIRDGKKLIDGGVVQNFPVGVAKDLGADFVIGVNVSQGLQASDQLNTPVDILYQMGFYVDAHNFINDYKLTDIYIEPDLTGFTAASFTNAAEIIERGKIAARKQLVPLIQLAENLKTLNQPKSSRDTTLIQKQYVVDSVVIEGNKILSDHFIHNKLNIHKGDTLQSKDFTSKINRLFATAYFVRVNYSLSVAPNPDHVILTVDVDEKPTNGLLAAINFSSFTGVGLIVGWQSNRFLFNNAKANTKVLIGENPAFKAGISYYLGNKQKHWFAFDGNGFRLNFPVYDNFRPVYEYVQTRAQIGLSINALSGKNSFLSIGTSFFYHELKPKIISDKSVEGHNTGFETFFKWNYHSLNRNAFPLSGQKISFQTSLIHGQTPKFDVKNYNGEIVSLSTMNIEIQNFIQALFSWEKYLPVGKRMTQIIRLQSGYNFNYDQSFINSFNMGGTNNFLDKQFIFTGLNEYEVITNSVCSGAYGLQYSLGNSLYTSALVNGAVYDFDLEKLNLVTIDDNFVIGAGLSLGYLSLLGPIELTFSYSPQTNKTIGYINLGWYF